MYGTKAKLSLRELSRIALMSALIAVCAWISIPIPTTNVSFTMQLFGVFMALRFLGGRSGTISVILYMLIGLAGAPVFSKFQSGPAALIGPTGGYILGFAAICALYWALEKKLGNRYLKDVVLFAGLIICYALGTAWFVYAMGAKGKPYTVGAALIACVVPFVIPDVLKLVLSDLVADRLEKIMKAK